MFKLDAIHPLLTIAALDMLGAMTPGPSVLFVIHCSTGSGTRRRGIAGAVGVVAASSVWAALSIWAVATALVRTRWVMGLLQTVGGMYVLLIAVETWRARNRVNVEPSESDDRSAAMKGFLIGISNPKVILFYSVILTQAWNTGVHAGMKAAALATIVATEMTWYVGLAAILSQIPRQHSLGRWRPVIKKVLAALLGVLAIRLISLGASSLASRIAS